MSQSSPYDLDTLLRTRTDAASGLAATIRTAVGQIDTDQPSRASPCLVPGGLMESIAP